MKKTLLIIISILQVAILFGQYKWQPYQSTYVPDNSVQIALELNRRYNDNLRLRNKVVGYCSDLRKFELTELEISLINKVNENIIYWDARGDYENATMDFSSNFYTIDALHEKYHPNDRYELCADFMNEIIDEGKYYTGLDFTSVFIKSVWFYSKGYQYYAIVEFNESYRAQENLTKNRRYIYCGLTLSEVDEFLILSNESYGDKFHRIIKPNKCRCD